MMPINGVRHGEISPLLPLPDSSKSPLFLPLPRPILPSADPWLQCTVGRVPFHHWTDPLCVTNTAVCSSVFTVTAITNNQSPFCPPKAPALHFPTASSSLRCTQLFNMSTVFICRIRLLLEVCAHYFHGAIKCSRINSIAHIALFVLLSNIVCTVACHECTADAPVDTLTDGPLIRTVT